MWLMEKNEYIRFIGATTGLKFQVPGVLQTKGEKTSLSLRGHPPILEKTHQQNKTSRRRKSKQINKRYQINKR